ncbi:MAG: EAL domain-containing protein [Syntrophobacteraceae bacterium]|jgi:diguanylate cyclase (GGDEF)-like protein|nr:EAL domain-containing protein [Syntrophobacteraceae bacterium]
MMMQGLNMDKPLVLIVDDDPVTQLIHCQALDHSDISVILADNGQKALGSFAEHNPDMVLLDVQMPDMDGFEVCKAIRDLGTGREVPILMITGMDDIDSIKKAFQVGATDFVTKPVKPLILIERIRYMLRARRAFQELHKAKEAALKAQRIARLGSWELMPASGSFLISDQVRRICGMNGKSVAEGWDGILERVHPDDQKRLRDAMQDAFRFGRSQLLDHRVVLSDRTERILSHQIEVEVNECGDVFRLYGTVQDITERKRGELFEADRNRILQSIVQSQPLPSVLDDLVKVLECQCPSALGCVCMVQDGQIKVMAAPGLSEPFAQALDSLRVGPESGCCGAAAYLGQAVTAPDISRGSFWNNCLDSVTAEGVHASLSVPIQSGKGRVLGTVSLFYRFPHKSIGDDLPIVERMAQLAAVAIEQCHLSELLVHQAKHDSLTGLLNRSALAQLMGYRLNGHAGNGGKSALLLIDLDRFKRINDSLGHQIGDQLLCQVGERLKTCIRKNDLLGRIGGDEFLLVLAPMRLTADAEKAARRILKALTEPFHVQGHQLYIGASVGISIHPDDGTDPSILQKNADISMYVAKNEGGNGFKFFSPEMNASVVERLHIENDLRKAVERGEFELHYQPQYDLQTGKIAALEALIRWNHPEAGRVPPDRFIHVAEETNLIIPIGTWVIREACRQSARWKAQGYGPVRIAVNVSAVQFTQPDFAEIVECALTQNQLDPKLLEIEITETVIMKDKEEVRKNLGKLKHLGVMTTIDDFGTGYSSITYLRQMPLDCLKIDRSFIKELVGEEAASLRTKNLVRAFVSLAKNLNLKLVAEGIENTDQCKFVSALGCEMGQGFLFSAPLPADEIAPFLEEGQVYLCKSLLGDGMDKLPGAGAC